MNPLRGNTLQYIFVLAL